MSGREVHLVFSECFRFICRAHHGPAGHMNLEPPPWRRQRPRMKFFPKIVYAIRNADARGEQIGISEIASWPLPDMQAWLCVALPANAMNLHQPSLHRQIGRLSFLPTQVFYRLAGLSKPPVQFTKGYERGCIAGG